MSDDLRELAKAVEAAASSAQASDHWAGFYALKVGPAGNVYEEVAELGSVSVVIDDLLTDLDARDAEIARLQSKCRDAAKYLKWYHNNSDQQHPTAESMIASLREACPKGVDDEG